MSHPNLYRSGNTTSPRFENVRVGTDIIVHDGKVGPNDGGVSTFSQKNSLWADNKTWVLQRSTPLVTGLKAINDHGTHWLIAPSQEMTLETYKSHLTSLNSKAVRYDRLPKSVLDEQEPEARVLKMQSAHSDRATRFAYNALASVAQTRIPVAGWDENDYDYVAVLAHALEDGTLQLSALVWDPTSVAGGWSREKAFTAHAVSAYMGQGVVRAKASGSEDDEADVANDHAYLRAVFKLDDAKNPFAAVDASAAA